MEGRVVDIGAKQCGRRGAGHNHKRYLMEKDEGAYGGQ